MKNNYNNNGKYDIPEDYTEVIIKEKEKTEEYKEFVNKWMEPKEFNEILKLLNARKVEG